MNPLWRQRIRRFRFLCGGAIALCIIALAVLFGLVQVLLPLAAKDPDRIATFISDRLHQPVRFASVQGRWQPSGPLLVLHDVQIGGSKGSAPVKLPVADVKLDFGALLVPGRQFVNLRLVDLNLDLVRAVDGSWSIEGIRTPGESGSQHLDLTQLPGSLLVDSLKLSIRDARSGRTLHFHSRQLRISSDGRQLRFACDLLRPGLASGLDMTGRFDVDTDSGTLYLGARGADFAGIAKALYRGDHAIESGHGDLQAWVRWKQARMESVILRMDVQGLSLAGPVGGSRVGRLDGLLGLRRLADGWDMRYASANGGVARVRMQGKDQARMLWVGARRLDLAPLLPVLAQVPGLPPKLGAWLAAAAPQGLLSRAALQWSAVKGLQSLDVRFDHLQWAAVGRHPGLDAFSGVVFGNDDAILLSVPTQPVTLRLPGTFRTPIVLDRVGGSLVAWKQGGIWQFGSTGLQFAGKGFAGQARGRMHGGEGGKPFLDLYVALQHADVQAAKLFWPVNVMHPKAVAWLDRALVDGQLDHARVLLRGDLADWPFRDHQGRFEARGEASDVTLDYSPQWPRAVDVHAVASFVDDSMLVVADAGSSRGNQVKRATASIPSFHDPSLILNVQGQGSGPSMLDFIVHSPIAVSHAAELSALRLGGHGQFGFSLILPFRDMHQFTLGGSAQVRNFSVDNPTWGLHLRKLAGSMRFDGTGLLGKGLQADFHGVPVTLDLALGDGATGQAGHAVSASLAGHFDVPTLIEGRPELAALEKLTQGSADFDIGYDLYTSANAPAQQVLSVDSNLKGMALKLPAPLDKPAATVLPLQVRLNLPVAGADLRVGLGDLVQAQARLPVGKDAPWALAVHLGAQPPASIPADGLRVDGTVNDLDVSGWLQRAMAASRSPGSTRLRLDGVDVSARRAHVFGATFDTMKLRLVPEQGQIRMSVDGPQARGQLVLPTTDLQRRGVLAQMQRLYWPDTAAAQAQAMLQKRSGAPDTRINYADTGINPSALPPLHISVDDLRLGKAHLGQARFESWPTAKGMHIDQMRTRANDVQIMGSGDWNGTASDSHTRMNIDFGAANLGNLLTALGYENLFEGGRTQARLQASWPGEPSSLALQRMTGALQVDVRNGRIPDVQPGVGRLLGLMALTELPRRLSLDFGDVFGKGLGFDSIKGVFRLEDGVADTRNLTIKGPAAEIRITGSTNLRDKTYDQRIVVIPHLGNSLPVVGALAGGPVGAAVGLAVQGLLGRGLNRAASARYSLTGPWDKPDIKLLEKDIQPQRRRSQTQPGATMSTPPPAASVTVPAPASSRP